MKKTKEKSDFQKYLELQDWIVDRPIKFKNAIKKYHSSESLYKILASSVSFASYFIEEKPDKFQEEAQSFEEFFNACAKIVEIDCTQILNKLTNEIKQVHPYQFLIERGAVVSEKMIFNNLEKNPQVSLYLASQIKEDHITADGLADLIVYEKKHTVEVLVELINKVTDQEILKETLFTLQCEMYVGRRGPVEKALEDKGIKLIPMSEKDIEDLRSLGFEKSTHYYGNKAISHPTLMTKTTDDYSVCVYFNGIDFMGEICNYYQDEISNYLPIEPCGSVLNFEYALEEVIARLNNLGY